MKAANRSSPMFERRCVKVQNGAVFMTDHNLLCGKVRIRLRNLPVQKTFKRFNVEALREEAVSQRYKLEISNRFELLLQDDNEMDAESLWTKTGEEVITVADEVIGRVKNRKQKEYG